MEDALVVLNDRDGDRNLLREAAAYATGADANLILYSPLSEAQFEESVSSLDQIGRMENKDYSDEDAIGVAEQIADSLASEALEDFDVEWSVATDVIDELDANRIIDLAEKHGCDHLFTLGQPRSPTGKAVFGDTTQKLILNFPGYVTVSMN
ncbi:universal stress protein [Natrinema zhouii]|uniref:Universal stress protein n=1 Tax=Natrinema zhouii TaxID=1710539 RepID=A0A7D6H021_9EURY|nr:universal stress protein [Natrinema zhouii]QLK26345.1 universal stress protein [Natrinema zhouii]